MRDNVFRKTLSTLLISCALIVTLSYALTVYVGARRRHAMNAPKEAAHSTARSAQEFIAAAEQDLKSGKIEQALVNFREALSLNPQSLPAQIGLAEGEYAAGREAVAANEFERARQIDNQNKSALLALARIHSHQASTWSQAESNYRDYLKQDPNDAHVKLGLARVLAWQHKAPDAVRLYELPDVAPLMSDADWRDFAFALVKTGRGPQAVPVLRTLLAKTPGDEELSLQLADIYAARKDWNAALPIYRDLLAKRPGDPSLNLSYGLGLLAAGRYQAALGPLEKARTAMPSSLQAGLAYARAVKGSGDLKRSVQEYERVLPQFEKDAPLVREYADVLLEKKDYKKSAHYYGVAYGLGVRDNRLLEGYVGALSGAGKYREELPYLEELYQREPTPRVTFELAKLLHRLGRNDRAKVLLSQLETTSPKLARSSGF